MNVDEAMKLAEAFKASVGTLPPEIQLGESVAITLSAEVERLRAELAEVKADRDSWVTVYNAWKEACNKAEAELAAAKAASVWPVGWTEIRTNPGGNVVIYTENHENAYRLMAWLRDRIKERGEG